MDLSAAKDFDPMVAHMHRLGLTEALNIVVPQPQQNSDSTEMTLSEGGFSVASHYQIKERFEQAREQRGDINHEALLISDLELGTKPQIPSIQPFHQRPFPRFDPVPIESQQEQSEEESKQ
jgi:hypothetical protein